MDLLIFFYDDYMGGYEEGYSLCAFCLKERDERKMNFKYEDKLIIKRINGNSVRAQQSESNNKPIAEVEFLSLVIYDSVMFAERLWKRGDCEHAKQYIQSAIECNIRVISLLRKMKYNLRDCKQKREMKI